MSKIVCEVLRFLGFEVLRFLLPYNLITLQPDDLTCVENNGFEPLTPCLQSRCSSQLS